MSNSNSSKPSSFSAAATTLALIDRFSANLVAPPAPPGTGGGPTTAAATVNTSSSSSTSTSSSSTPPAGNVLLLLSAAAKSLKAQVTKLSLLSVTSTSSSKSSSSSSGGGGGGGAAATASVPILQSINDSVLPSLVTATLLVSSADPDASETFIPSFSNECRRSVQTTLKNLKALVEILFQSEGHGNGDRERKTSLTTEATGRVWHDCDSLVALSDGGVPAFVVAKANQWLDLMKDAVQELQDWDPEDDDDFDEAADLLGLDDDPNHSHDEDEDEDEGEDEEDEGEKDDKGDKHRAVISAGVKDQALKVLSRIPQSVHVVVKQRLEKLPPSTPQQPSTQPSIVKSLDTTLARLASISELIDESAEAMYLGNPELCLKKAGEARALTIELVEDAYHHFQPRGRPAGSTGTCTGTGTTATAATATSSKHQDNEGQSSKDKKSKQGESKDRQPVSQEDKYVKRALDWIRQSPSAS